MSMYTRRMARAKRRMFLTWLLVNVLSVCLFVALWLGGFADGIGGAPVYAMVAIFAIGGAASGYAGWLNWRADDWLEKDAPMGYTGQRDSIVHDAQHVFYAVAVCQLLGLVGALMGYRQEAGAAALPDAAEAIKLLTLGLGNGLSATLFGVIVSLLLWAQHHILVHRLEKPHTIVVR